MSGRAQNRYADTTRGPGWINSHVRTQPGRPLTRLRTAAAVLLVSVFCAATARLFVWPARGMPARVDAIVMLDGPGDRLSTALGLAWAQRAPVAVISRGSPQ